MFTKKLTIVGSILVITISGFLISACGEQSPIKIGFIGGLTGRSADISQASRNAVQMAIEEVNKHGGINGRSVDLLVRDNEGNADTAAQKVGELVKAGVDAIIGPNLSSIAGGMLPVLNELEVVTISPTVSSLKLAGKDDSFFRINSNTRQNAGAYAAYHHANGGRRVAAALDGNNRLFTESWFKEFTAAFEKLGGEVVATEMYAPKMSGGYSAVVAPLLSADPDAIVMVSNGVDTAQLAQQIRKVNNNVKLIAAEWAASEQLIELGGKAVEGLVILQTYDRNDQSEHYRRFATAYQQRFKSSPGYSSVAAYDAATVLFAALAKRSEGQSLKSLLLSQGPVKGLQQDIIFDAFGDSSRRQVFVAVKNGGFVVE